MNEPQPSGVIDTSKWSAEFKRGWDAAIEWSGPFGAFRGLCGHVWMREEDGDECPHCAARRASDAQVAGLREAGQFMVDLIDVVYGTDNEGMDLPEEAEFRRYRAVIKGATPAPQPATRPVDTEFAWLIERGQPEKQVPTVWLVQPTRWTTDAFEATRFPSKAAAEAWMAEHSGYVPSQVFVGRAVEHGFSTVNRPVGVSGAVRYWREFAGLTLRELGRRVDADFTYLSKIENDHDRPSLSLIQRIDSVTGAEGQLVEAWQGTRCPSCGARLAEPRSPSQAEPETGA